ncbi:hypothetical protein LIA77_02275 [Sarocladium implicatum]|nr:hypothetical protein LIA77_02275 [Sarocladium implicatum]
MFLAAGCAERSSEEIGDGWIHCVARVSAGDGWVGGRLLSCSRGSLFDPFALDRATHQRRRPPCRLVRSLTSNDRPADTDSSVLTDAGPFEEWTLVVSVRGKVDDFRVVTAESGTHGRGREEGTSWSVGDRV